MSSSYFAASVLAEGVGLLVLKGTGSTDVWASGLGELLIAANADDFVQKGHAWASQQRDAIAFLLEQKEKGSGYFNPDRVPNAMRTIVRAVFAGETQGRFDRSVDSVLVYRRPDKKARLAGIVEPIGASRLNKVMFYKAGFEQILDLLETTGIKLNRVIGIHGNVYAIEGVLTRDLSPRDKRGMKVGVKINSGLRRALTMHNDPVLRDNANATTATDRMQGSMHWSHLIPRPVSVLHEGRSSLGHTEPNASNHVIMFSISGYVDRGFEDTLAELARKRRENGTLSNDLVLLFQELFLGLWHAHSNGVLIGNINPQNIGQTPDGKVVFCDLGLGRCGAPKHGQAFGKQSGPTPLNWRNSTVYFATGTNPKGDPSLYQASGQYKRKIPFLFLTRQDLLQGDALSRQRERGLGRLGNGIYTFYDCEAAEERAKEEERAKKGEQPPTPYDRKKEEAGEVFQALRTALQFFNQPDWRDPDDWERRATAAAADPKKMLEFLLSGTRGKPQQPLALQRFAIFFANGLGQHPRPGLIRLMTSLALTVPVHSPADERDILRRIGISFPGGLAGRVYAGIKSEWRGLFIPPSRAQIEPDGKNEGGHMGLGLQAVKAIKKGQFVTFYCGTKRADSDGEGPMDTFPSRFGVSIRSSRQTGKFSINGFTGRKLTMQWLKDHQATGMFMNAGDWKGGPGCNVMLDRHKAWTDPATGIVWIPMYAICDIASGDFLRWKYSPVDGEGGFYNFKDELQTMRGVMAVA
jgi:hypothetical protein